MGRRPTNGIISVHVLSFDGQNLRSQSMLEVPSASPDYSPDGLYMVVEAWPGGDNNDIYVMTAIGTNPDQLTIVPAQDYQPAWRPGG